MTTLKEFQEDPGDAAKAHELYKACFFRLPTMPELVSSEAILGSLYRHIGLAWATEREVGSFGTEFRETLEKRKTKPQEALLNSQNLKNFLTRHIESPLTHGQTGNGKLRLYPLVPELANYTSAVRLKGSPWNPGRLIAQTIKFGSKSLEMSNQIWNNLYNALAISDDEDILAKFLQQEIEAWRPQKATKAKEVKGTIIPNPLNDPDGQTPNFLGGILDAPARQFVDDLQKVINLKPKLTRREWLGYLETLLRFGLVTHSQWLCQVNSILWQLIAESLRTGDWDEGDFKASIYQGINYPLWALGKPYASRATEIGRKFLEARYGINLLIYSLQKEGKLPREGIEPAIDLESLLSFGGYLCKMSAESKNREMILADHRDLLEKNPRLTNSKTGFTKNLRIFWLYSMTKSLPMHKADHEYDQGFWCQKRTPDPRSPWVVNPGPMVLSLVAHCCVTERSGGATINDLKRHLQKYRVGSEISDFIRGPLAERMRGLGIVVDSPDAESGMGILDPIGGV